MSDFPTAGEPVVVYRMAIDTHCHLTLRFEPYEYAGVLDRAARAGVEGILLVGYCPTHYRRTADILDQFGTGGGRLPALAGTIGIHPHEADKYGPENVGEMRSELERDDIVAIGETGLDFYRDYADRNRQEELFRAQVKLSGETGYPLVIHSRSAFDKTMEIIGGHDLPDPPGVFHCYGYGPKEVDRVLDRGFFVSFAGNLTYPKAEELRSAAARVPKDRFLVETDSPFMVPQKAKNRKVRRCEPALVMETFGKFVELRGWNESEARDVLVGNSVEDEAPLEDSESEAEPEPDTTLEEQ